MEEHTTSSPIYLLPDEILLMILRFTSYADCNSFRRTCKQYNELIRSSNHLWKVFYFNTVNEVIYRNTEPSGDWQSKLKEYLTLKNTLIQMIANMSSKHSRKLYDEIIIDDAKEFFDIAMTGNRNYYWVIAILQDFIVAAYKKINTNNTERPFTLTEVYFSKSILRYLFHMLFTLKWTQYKITNQLTPDVVLNFFTQWIDPVKMHRDEEVSTLISDMIKDVDRQLLIGLNNKSRLPGEDSENTCLRGLYSEREVVTAISRYMYKERRMVLTEAFNQDTLCVVKTIKSNTGNTACLGAIFEAIARGFGVTSCRLITFPNHMYFEWRPNDSRDHLKHYINLKTGELRAGGRCPFSANPDPRDVRYSPESLLEYIISYYMQYMGDFKTWPLENAVHLLKFVTNSPGSSYCDFQIVHSFLEGYNREKILLPFNLENVHQEHLNYVSDLVNLCMNKTPPRPLDTAVKRRSVSVKYCVGMICFHKVYDYICVIRGWELHSTQCLYYVTAVDQSNRCISQHHLEILHNPSRIFHLEDIIAKEFTHFNGFFYEPNAEKQLLYPEDMAIGMAYTSKRLKPRASNQLTKMDS